MNYKIGIGTVAEDAVGCSVDGVVLGDLKCSKDNNLACDDVGTDAADNAGVAQDVSFDWPEAKLKAVWVVEQPEE